MIRFGGGRRGSFTLGLIIAAITLISYYGSSDVNQITGEKQYVAMSPDQEIALGLQSAPQMANQYGGLSQDSRKASIVDIIGKKIVAGSAVKNTNWNFQFHLLADKKTINAFALPGGQVFITEGLFDKLSTEDEIAGVLAHEIGHVIARHGAQHLAKQRLANGMTAATVVATGDNSSGQMAAMIGQMVNLKYGRNDEIQSDVLGVRFMSEAGYDPNALIDVMHILAKEAGSGRTPEFFSSHPNPENRIENIKEAIRKQNDTTKYN